MVKIKIWIRQDTLYTWRQKLQTMQVFDDFNFHFKMKEIIPLLVEGITPYGNRAVIFLRIIKLKSNNKSSSRMTTTTNNINNNKENWLHGADENIFKDMHFVLLAWGQTKPHIDGLVVANIIPFYQSYRHVSNIRRTLVGNWIVDHSDVVGPSPIGAAPTTSSLST